MGGHGHRIPSLCSVSSLLTVLHPAIRRELIRFRWFRKVNTVAKYPSHRLRLQRRETRLILEFIANIRCTYISGLRAIFQRD